MRDVRNHLSGKTFRIEKKRTIKMKIQRFNRRV